MKIYNFFHCFLDCFSLLFFRFSLVCFCAFCLSPRSFYLTLVNQNPNRSLHLYGQVSCWICGQKYSIGLCPPNHRLIIFHSFLYCYVILCLSDKTLKLFCSGSSSFGNVRNQCIVSLSCPCFSVSVPLPCAHACSSLNSLVPRTMTNIILHP